MRLRSLYLARDRCRTFKSANCPPVVFVANARQSVPANIVETQLGTRMRLFSADDDPHSLRPVLHVQDTGEFGDVGSPTRLVVGVIRWFPGVQLRGLSVEGGPRRRQHPPDRIRRTPLGEKFRKSWVPPAVLVRMGTDLPGRAFPPGRPERTSLTSSRWSTAVFDPALLGRNSCPAGSPQPELPWSMNASGGRNPNPRLVRRWCLLFFAMGGDEGGIDINCHRRPGITAVARRLSSGEFPRLGARCRRNGVDRCQCPVGIIAESERIRDVSDELGRIVNW
jgi:hypothetical protein